MSDEDGWDKKEWIKENKTSRSRYDRLSRLYMKAKSYLNSINVDWQPAESCDWFKEDVRFNSYAGILYLRNTLVLVEEHGGLNDNGTYYLDKFFDRQLGIGYSDISERDFGPKDIRSVKTDVHDFLKTYEWRVLRYKALKRSNGKCAACGNSPDNSAILNVDHIKPRATHPELALSIDNLQVLCHQCNHGKSNWDETDWRSEPIATPEEEHDG